MQKVNKSINEQDNKKIVLDKFTQILCTDKPDTNYCNSCPPGQKLKKQMENQQKHFWCEDENKDENK